jgi:hypothetical protein
VVVGLHGSKKRIAGAPLRCTLLLREKYSPLHIPITKTVIICGVASLDLARDKIIRAAEHLKTIEEELRTYFELHPARMVREPNGPPNEATFKIQPTVPIPARLPHIIGDCVQNTRTSLDYLVRELVLAANNQPTDHEMFPICHTAGAFKHALRRGQLTGVPKDAITVIESVQPYQLGQDWGNSILWVLNEFANINKHRRLLVTVLRAAESKVEVVTIGGKLFATGTIPRFNDDARIGPFPMVGENQMQVNTQIVASVTFNEGTATGIEVCTCLNAMLIEIYIKVLPRFEIFFV